MWFSSWLRRSNVSPKRRPAPRFRPHLEALEDRTVPATFIVTTAADVVDPADGELSLREAILAANAAWTTANTIVVPAGAYNLTRAGTSDFDGGDLDINNNAKGLTISGAGAGTTMIDGAGLYRVFDFHSGTVSIAGLTIQGGNAGTTSNGGGIRNEGAILTVSDCIFSGDTTAGPGGGAIWNNGTLTVNHCIFSGNSATNIIYSHGGGAIWNYAGTATISDSTFTGNSARNGGGILNQGALTVSNSTFSGNSATGVGDGGAIDNQKTMSVVNCTLSGNSASQYGGGISNRGGKLTLRGSTVTGNSAPVGADLFNSGKVSLFDTVIGDRHNA